MDLERRRTERRSAATEPAGADLRQGERRRSRGRPTIADARYRKIGFKASEQEERRIGEVARLNGQSVSEFVRSAVESAAAECSDAPVLRPAD